MNPQGLQVLADRPEWPEGVRFVLAEALEVADGAGTSESPGAILIEVTGARSGVLRGPARVLAVGRPAEVLAHPASGAASRLRMPEAVLLPGFVNAHTHLDLTSIGPRPFAPSGGFMGWIELIRRERPADDLSIATSVRRGVELSLAGGTVAVGDVGGAPAGRPSLSSWRALADSGLVGVSFLEFFAIGRGEDGGLERAQRALEESGELSGEVRLGLQPHAPNTVSIRGYEWALGRGLPLATHLAETLAEREFMTAAAGPQREFLERIGLWDDQMLSWVGRGRRPVEHLRSVLERAKFVLAHVNDASDSEIELLARTGQSVAYCPRASEYFGNSADLGEHRYREMLGAGIPVALGTDSIVNLPNYSRDPGRGGMSIFDEMRLLYRRDGTDARILLAMATVHGATALGLDSERFRFVPGGPLQGLVAVKAPAGGRAGALERALMREEPPSLLLAGK